MNHGSTPGRRPDETTVHAGCAAGNGPVVRVAAVHARDAAACGERVAAGSASASCAGVIGRGRWNGIGGRQVWPDSAARCECDGKEYADGKTIRNRDG